jgi:ATP-binding cassette, subfamily F, member 3
MAIITANDLGKYFGAQDIFQNISIRINKGERIGLVGPNGQGKTTLLRIIAGLEHPTTGQVTFARDLSIGYLPQHGELEGDQRLYQAMLEPFEGLRRQQTVLHDLEAQMAETNCPPAVFERYGELQTRFELAGGYTYEAHIRRVLGGLGFNEDEYDKPLSILSGGERTRARLARLLLEEPELLLLDEPTNHLDLAGVEWLESYLAAWKGSLVVVAHDRRFLDRVTTRIWDMALGRLESYSGNYSHYITQREERMERRLAEYEAQQEHIAATEAYIRRYKAGQLSRQAKGRQRRLDRLERLERPRETKRIHLSIQTDVRSGDLVLRTRDLVVGYAGPPRLELVSCPDLLLLRGERAALLGPNGSGKTTLVKTIVNQLAPLGGEVKIGSNVCVGYLAQAHADLALDSTVLDEILNVRNLPLAEARNYLGRFLFSGDDIHKRVRDLSGGERSRVALAKLTLEGANFLILDEPTNHLDIASQEILEDVLDQFRGTILLVSHDREFVDNLATQVWMLQGSRLITFAGNYGEYLESLEAGRLLDAPDAGARAEGQKQQEAEERQARKQEDRRRQREERQRQERLQRLEETMASLERDLHQLEANLARASSESRVNDVSRLGRQHEETRQHLDRLLEEWAELA